MKHNKRSKFLFAGTFLLGSTFLTGIGMAADLSLKRAILGSGGVGYFEYTADVEGDDTIIWRAQLDQVDDILKSIVVLDEAGPASITLPGKASLETAFTSLPFGVQDLSDMPNLLNALRGAEISVSGQRKITGRIVNVTREQYQPQNGKEITLTRTRISLMSNGSIEQFILEDAENVTFSDQTIGKQVTTALEALKDNQDRSSRNIAIRLSKDGKRTIRVGMVTEAPVWKAAYRLSLPDKNSTEKNQVRLQGWAVLENMTGSDWKDVEVTLSAASPVTFRQLLYKPYYVSRPTIAPPVSQALLPVTDEGQMRYRFSQNIMEKDFKGTLQEQKSPSMASSRNYALKKVLPPPPSPALSDSLGGQTDTSMNQENIAGSSFTLKAKISVKAGESITTPFIDLTTDSNSVAWIQAMSSGQAKRTAWHAVALHNSSDTTLPPGAVTLYENTAQGPLFSGEAQLATLPTNDTRMLGFGLEQKLSVNTETDNSHEVVAVKVKDGLVEIKRNSRIKTLYRVKNSSDTLRQVVLEHPKLEQYKLINHEELKATLIPNAYRLKFDVKAGETKPVEVIVETPVYETIAYGDFSENLINMLTASSNLDSTTKSRLVPVRSAAVKLADLRRELNSLEETRNETANDQNRIRQNLNASPSGSDLQRLYSQKLLEQEKNFDQLDQKIKSTKADIEKAYMELSKAIETLT